MSDELAEQLLIEKYQGVKKEDLRSNLTNVKERLEILSEQAEILVDNLFESGSGINPNTDSDEQLERKVEELIDDLVGSTGPAFNSYFGAVSELNYSVQNSDHINPENAERLNKIDEGLS